MSAPAPNPPERRVRRLLGWRLGTPVVVLVCGGLFAVSAANSQGTDLRPGRYTDLATIAGTEAQRYQRLEERLSALNAEVQELTDQVDDNAVNKLNAEIEKVEDPAGFTARSGPGLTITLSDAPRDIIDDVDDADRLSDYIVHQQDVQAVVNALWAGGAEAITIQGQRVISTTGIKCSGSTIQLGGVPYPQPFVIEAVGDIGDLTRAVDDDPAVSIYRGYAANPDYQLGWSMEPQSYLEAPAYDGLPPIGYAEPIS